MVGALSYRFVLARGFGQGLDAAEEAISLAPDMIWLYGNRVHALMFLDRVDEAQTLYLHYRGQKNVQNQKSWEEIILGDFVQLRKAGRAPLLLDEIEKRFVRG